MGIESDQLVYDYLSRVGDLAQQQQLSSGARMRLVSTLRTEIDRQRGALSADTPATVRRIIGGLGAPDELVAKAAESGGGRAASTNTTADAADTAYVADPPDAPRASRAPRTPRAFRTFRSAGPPPTAVSASPPPAAEPPRASPLSRLTRPSPAPHAPRTEGTDGAASRADGADGTDGVEGADREDGPGRGGTSRPSGGIPRPRRGPLGMDVFRKGVPDTSRKGAPKAPKDDPPVPGGGPLASPPHLAGMDELGPSGSEADWWRVEPGPFGGVGDSVPGFVGGVEIPEMFRPWSPGRPDRATDDGDGDDDRDGTGADRAAHEVEDETAESAGAGRTSWARSRLRLRRRRTAPAAAPRARISHPLLLFAAGLLVVGAVIGSWLALAGGWLLAYSSRKLSRAEAKWAAMGLPGAVAAGGLVWLWGRLDGRWGTPVPEDGTAQALSDMWPVLLRTAAVASALFLIWRARRSRG
ncbi:hypothetical protein ACPXCE_16175 [Streptomyces sp. DT24]|uniref:hypothetical protein n=1 Tax=unclassified Streptomyces TaxID=2593676 RepID=UPI003CF19048